MTNQTNQPDIQEQPQSNLPAVVGTLLDNLKAVIADQVPDDDAYVLAIEMVGTIETKFVQVIEDGRMMVEAALEQRDEAISLKELAEEKAEEILEALSDWTSTDNEEIRDMVESIEEGISEYLYDSWASNVADDEFVEQLAQVFGMLVDNAAVPDVYDTALLILRLADYGSIPNPLRITKQNVDVMEAVFLKLKELAAKADPNFYGVRPDEDAEVEDGEEDTE